MQNYKEQMTHVSVCISFVFYLNINIIFFLIYSICFQNKNKINILRMGNKYIKQKNEEETIH